MPAEVCNLERFWLKKQKDRGLQKADPWISGLVEGSRQTAVGKRSASLERLTSDGNMSLSDEKMTVTRMERVRSRLTARPPHMIKGS